MWHVETRPADASKILPVVFPVKQLPSAETPSSVNLLLRSTETAVQSELHQIIDTKCGISLL